MAELAVVVVPGQRELFRASIRDDSIELVAANPLYEGVPSAAAWALALGDLFHHAIDGAVEAAGADRLRSTVALRGALAEVDRAPHVGLVRFSGGGEELPRPDESSFEVVRAKILPGGDVEMALAGGLGWSASGFLQWSQLLFDLVHAAAQLEQLDPVALMNGVFAEIDRPTTMFRGTRCRVSNILPRGDRTKMVSLPRVLETGFEVRRVDLGSLPVAPIESLGIALELSLPYEPDERGLATDAEDERIRVVLRATVKGSPQSDGRFVAQRECAGVAQFLFYLRDEKTAERFARRFLKEAPGGHCVQAVDLSWSRFQRLRPDRDELRWLANCDWLDALARQGHDLERAAIVVHAIWANNAKARDELAESLSRAGYWVIASPEGSPGRWECLVEQYLEGLAGRIHSATRELEALALEAGALYDGWDLKLPD